MKKLLVFRLKKPNISYLMEKRVLWIVLAILFLTFMAMVWSVGVGEYPISPWNVIKVFLGLGSDQENLIVMKFRMPRLLIGMLVGMGLGVSGAILQSIIRNPLASPDIIGITSGASVAAVVFIVLFETASIFWLPLFAIVGAGIAGLLIYVLAWKKGVTPVRLVLIGVGVKEILAALTTLITVASPLYLTPKAKIWLTGSVYGTSWDTVSMLAPWIACFMLLAFIYGRSVNLLQLGDDVAQGAGSAVELHRLILLSFSVALAGAAVAIGGAISFVGLLAPHIAKKVVGPVFGALLPASALLGALIVLVSDLVARTVFAPLDLPVGIFTSLIGAPFFIFLLVKNRNK
ncbi:iron chelate uptake ABC transporter family permease subunit [Brevibacillus laterosporus]|uniref:FecCD family ABC transporter permease n=1 Tax=Brevibacillus laterosporus TaxID=1465 RepID=UPI00215C20E1|nr:iron ABC transporter permease [Brevibacillus laterosporus]MCR8996014.1 iron ABC transporter permease [Brevibacillus laterosporus]